MFCEMNGKIVSDPMRSEYIEFEFLVESVRDIEVDALGRGELDCHLMQGKTIHVILDREDAGDLKQVKEGARLTLERYDFDVVNKESEIVRSIRYVRKTK